jgi:two-component system, sensor histidine kinase SagS
MNQAQRTIRLLQIGSDELADLCSAEVFGRDVEVSRAATLEDALNRMSETSFDYVLASPLQIKSLRAVSSMRSFEGFVDDREGVGIADGNGELVWSNPRLVEYSDEIRGLICEACRETYRLAKSDSAETRDRVMSGRRVSVKSSSGNEYELTATPIADKTQRITQVVAVVHDVTEARARQKKLDAINVAGRELMRMDVEQVSKLRTHERLSLLEKKIVQCLHDLMEFDNFTIHLLDKKTNKLEPVLLSGMPPSVQSLDLYALPEGNGIAGYVAYHGRSYICSDVEKDPHYFEALVGARSSLTMPLRLNDEVIGVLNVESNQPNAFDDESRDLAEILGRDIATALHILDLLVTERYATTGRLCNDVMAEVTGPLNDILTDVETLVEDYIGHDDLRHRLNRITENVVSIRDAIKQTTSPKRGVLGHRTGRGDRRDPILTGKRVLIADDEVMIRETVRDVLQSYGCEIVVAENGDQAAAFLADQEFDLILSDIKMPGKNGYEVFALAKDGDADLPVILMTGFGYDPNHSIVRARREGLAAVLFKPFKVDQLLGEIRAALHHTAD